MRHMEFFKSTTNIDFMGKRRFFLFVSGIAVLLSLLTALAIGPKFGIDFIGGTEIQVQFKKPATSAQIRGALKEMGFPTGEVVTFGAHESEYLIRLQAISPIDEKLAASAEASFKKKFADAEVSRFELSPGGDKLTLRLSKNASIKEVENAVKASGLGVGSASEEPNKTEGVENAEEVTEGGEEKQEKQCQSATCTWSHQETRIYEINLKGLSDRVMEGLRAKSFGQGAVKMRSEWVGPKVGRQLRVAGISSIAYALLFIMIYIAVRFDLRFAPGAVVALIHDVLITVGVFTITRTEVTLATVAALLTIVGYSLNDTIVVFDRIRENMSKVKDSDLSKVINTSINQVLSRTILTSVTTLIVVTVMLLMGWKTSIRDFSFALLVGVVIGTYSSVYVASPIVVWLDKRIARKRA